MFEDLIFPDDNSKPFDQSNIFKDIYFNSIGKKINAILVTPICDLAHSRYDHLHLCAVLPFESFLFQLIKKKKKTNIMADVQILELIKKITDNKFIKDYKDDVLKLINNNVARLHWIGKIPELDNYWMIDYSITNCIQLNELDINKRIAIIQSPLRESIFVRYAFFMGRVGLPFADNEMSAYCDNVLLENYSYFTG
ncbi:MAG: hypothetical protein ACYCXB_05515 [Candidatus Humimicrobiaceae bacterium]